MSQTRVAIAGVAGRMGRTLVATISELPDLELVAGLEHPSSADLGKDTGALAGIGDNAITVTADIQEAVQAADVLIDFTTPQTSVALAEGVAGKQCAHVVGTTGFDEAQNRKMETAARQIAMVKSGNMSLGVNLLYVLAEQAA